jgi:CPA2 family monovalent cation:H+ antiporter-2
VQDQRDARYGLLRGYFHGADDDTVDALEQARLRSITLPESGGCLRQTLEAQALDALDVKVVALRRAGGSVLRPAPDTVLGASDTLVLSGQPAALARAEAHLLRA